MGGHEFTTFDKLPSELIVQIASRTTPETVLALARVSRSLRQSCYDSFVFLDSFRSTEWAKRHLGSLTGDIDLIARYAVAESRYLQFIENDLKADKQKTEVVPTTSELLRYLPNLVILNNEVPSLDREFLLARRLVFTARFPDEAGLRTELAVLEGKRPIVSLMSACGLLRVAPFIPSSSSLNEQLDNHNAITFYTYDNLAEGIRSMEASFKQRFFHDNLIGVGKMAMLLACAFPDPVKNPDLPAGYLTAGRRFPSHVDIPIPSKIPLVNSPTTIPLPFLPAPEALESWKIWMRRQRSTQSTPAYMDSGEWVGMYTYNDPFPLGAIAARFDAPMTGIRFRTQGPLTNEGGFFSQASGTDGVGEYDITLTQDGHGDIRGSKSYRHQRTSWSWYLSNTPFGLYGLWTSQRNVGEIGVLGGAVWLWKREWCESEGSSESL